jgi:SAM-dependent methyltransferase
MYIDYDQLAEQYRNHRKPDSRIAGRIKSHIKGAKRVLNVGSGIGSYEPENCYIVALEPSREMNTRRKNSKAALIQGVAENLPFSDNTFDISMAILTIHHWSDIESGLKEMARVSRKRVILFTWIGYGNDFWLENYIPEIRGVDHKLFPSLEELERILRNISVETIEIPYDCSDGFMCAYWRRPEAYLDQNVRRAISTFSRISNIQENLDRLQDDIYSGAWSQKHSHLLEKESLDLGYRLVVCETSSA